MGFIRPYSPRKLLPKLMTEIEKCAANGEQELSLGISHFGTDLRLWENIWKKSFWGQKNRHVGRELTNYGLA